MFIYVAIEIVYVAIEIVLCVCLLEIYCKHIVIFLLICKIYVSYLHQQLLISSPSSSNLSNFGVDGFRLCLHHQQQWRWLSSDDFGVRSYGKRETDQLATRFPWWRPRGTYLFCFMLFGFFDFPSSVEWFYLCMELFFIPFRDCIPWELCEFHICCKKKICLSYLCFWILHCLTFD